MFKKIKELITLNKALEDKKRQLSSIELELKNKDQIRIKMRGEIINHATTEANEIVKNAQNEIRRINQEILNKAEYMEEVEAIKVEHESISKKVTSQEKKLRKQKSLYQRIQYILEKYLGEEIFNQNVNQMTLNSEEYEIHSEFNPSVKLKLHCMDIKELRKRFKENEKDIDETLARYEGRYTTKANAAIYKLMVIALKAELQNILYNLKFTKLDNAIEDVKFTTAKYLKIAGEGNQSIINTLLKFINEIEYLFIKAVEIEYAYYIRKEQEKEEQARLREQMKQEAEERRLLEQEQKQVEKEEEKYKNEIAKVEELISNTKDDEKLKQLQTRISELQGQLEQVEHKKEEIVKRQNGKAGYVYIISNLGSFGEQLFKIGMTRRINPQDRVDELGDASVPFYFDVHSFIFSDNAVGLEQRLHGILNKRRVNKVNLRKEFFNVTINELETLVQEVDPTAEFNSTMIADQYRQSLVLNEDNELTA